MTADLFADPLGGRGGRESLGPGAAVLRGHALPAAPALLAAIEDIAAAAPFRHMVTPGGLPMSAAMSNCGRLGWVSDAAGYRYYQS